MRNSVSERPAFEDAEDLRRLALLNAIFWAFFLLGVFITWRQLERLDSTPLLESVPAVVRILILPEGFIRFAMALVAALALCTAPAAMVGALILTGMFVVRFFSLRLRANQRINILETPAAAPTEHSAAG